MLPNPAPPKGEPAPSWLCCPKALLPNGDELLPGAEPVGAPPPNAEEPPPKADPVANAEPPLGPPNAEPLLGAPNAEPPLGAPNAEPPLGAPNAEPLLGAPNAEPPLGAPNAEPLLGAPNAEPLLGAPNAEPPLGAPNAEPLLEVPNAEGPLGAPNAAGLLELPKPEALLETPKGLEPPPNPPPNGLLPTLDPDRGAWAKEAVKGLALALEEDPPRAACMPKAPAPELAANGLAPDCAVEGKRLAEEDEEAPNPKPSAEDDEEAPKVWAAEDAPAVAPNMESPADAEDDTAVPKGEELLPVATPAPAEGPPVGGAPDAVVLSGPAVKEDVVAAAAAEPAAEPRDIPPKPNVSGVFAAAGSEGVAVLLPVAVVASAGEMDPSNAGPREKGFVEAVGAALGAAELANVEPEEEELPDALSNVEELLVAEVVGKPNAPALEDALLADPNVDVAEEPKGGLLELEGLEIGLLLGVLDELELPNVLKALPLEEPEDKLKALDTLLEEPVAPKPKGPELKLELELDEEVAVVKENPDASLDLAAGGGEVRVLSFGAGNGDPADMLNPNPLREGGWSLPASKIDLGSNALPPPDWLKSMEGTPLSSRLRLPLRPRGASSGVRVGVREADPCLRPVSSSVPLSLSSRMLCIPNPSFLGPEKWSTGRFEPLGWAEGCSVCLAHPEVKLMVEAAAGDREGPGVGDFIPTGGCCCWAALLRFRAAASLLGKRSLLQGCTLIEGPICVLYSDSKSLICFILRDDGVSHAAWSAWSLDSPCFRWWYRWSWYAPRWGC